MTAIEAQVIEEGGVDGKESNKRGVENRSPHPGLKEAAEHNDRIGRVLYDYRTERDITISACADLLGTTRRRYVDMEKGLAKIGIGELMLLIRFLGVPVQHIWGDADTTSEKMRVTTKVEASEGNSIPIVVQAAAGKNIQIIVSVAD
ncbi:MAG TPA: helix-turn-helix transcriptional regulator [Chloroflexia bacterium]